MLIPLFKQIEELDIKFQEVDVKIVPRNKENNEQTVVTYQFELELNDSDV